MTHALERSAMSTSDINDLPDEDFAYIEDGGSKDDEGKTVPRSLRHFPIHDADHVRNALSRAPQSPFGDKAMPKIAKAAKKMGIGDYGDDEGSRSNCCPDHYDGEAHVFRRDFALDGLEILRSGQGGDGRTVEAYATVFDSPAEIKDQHGHYMETIHRAAFDDVLRGGYAGVKVFYNHGMNLQGGPSDRWSVPIGVPRDVRPDGRGLRTVTRYNEGDAGDQVLEAIRNGAITGYSFRGPIRQSDPPRVPRARDGQPLPTVTRTKLGLTEYGPTPMPYYAGAGILALRSRLATLDDTAWDKLMNLIASTPQDQEAIRTTNTTATPEPGPGAEDQPIEALRSAQTYRRTIAKTRVLERWK